MIYKRGKTWWYKFQWNGVSFRETTRQKNAQVARDMEASHRTSLAKGEVGIRDRSPVPTLINFCRDRIEPYAKPRTSWIWYRSGIRALLKYEPLANAHLDQISAERSAGFVAVRLAEGLENGSINSSLRVLRRILRLASEWGDIDIAPKIEMLRGESRRERVVTVEEESLYLAACTPLLADVATILFDTGVRPDELHRMRWEHVSWNSGRNGTILIAKGKTAAARRQIPMTLRVREVLSSKWKSQDRPGIGWVWPSATKTGHIDHSTTRKQHRKALTVSKVRPFVLYSLRHTFLTRLGASGCDVWTLMRIAGHSSIAISSRYVHPSEDTVLDAMEHLPVGGYKNRHTGEFGDLPGDRGVLTNPMHSEIYMVSADGLEPSTHALKGHQKPKMN